LIGEYIVEISTESKRRYSDSTAALVVVDRTLDLGLPALYSDNLMDLLYDCFPRKEPLSFHLKMPISRFLPNESFDIPLYHQMNNQVLEFIELISVIPFTEGLVAIRDKLAEIAGLSLKGKVTKTQFDELRSAIQGNAHLLYKYEPMLVYLFGWMDAYEHNLSIRQELFGIQKVIVASLAETKDPSYCIYQISDLLLRVVREKQQKLEPTFTTRDILLLTLFFYSLIGNEFVIESQHEQFLQESFVKAMMAVSNVN
jgi:hypothetical protein